MGETVSKIWYSPESAAEALDMHRLGFKDPAKTLKRLAKEGKINCGHFGKRIVFFPEDLMQLAAQVKERSRRGARRSA